MNCIWYASNKLPSVLLSVLVETTSLQLHAPESGPPWFKAPVVNYSLRYANGKSSFHWPVKVRQALGLEPQTDQESRAKEDMGSRGTKCNYRPQIMPDLAAQRRDDFRLYPKLARDARRSLFPSQIRSQLESSHVSLHLPKSQKLL